MLKFPAPSWTVIWICTPDEPDGLTANVIHAEGRGSKGYFSHNGLFEVEILAYPGEPKVYCEDLDIEMKYVVHSLVLRFKRGDLLYVEIDDTEENWICLDSSSLIGNASCTLRITGGTGKFKEATGGIRLLANTAPLLSSTTTLIVFGAFNGEMDGIIHRKTDD